jgi:hypothetical protein
MKLKISLIILTAAILASMPLSTTNRAHAQTAPTYDYAYAAAYFYSDFPLWYEFSGLDILEEYTWYIFTVDEPTGQLRTLLGTRQHLAGSTTDSWFYGAGDYGRWPEGYTGPIRVIDNLGATLGDHYVTPFPSVNGDSDVNDWYDTGNQALYEKLLIGNRNQAGSECQSAIFNPINSDGWHHGFKPCQVATYGDDYALLHYQFDPTTYVAPTSDTIVIFRITSAGYEQTVAIDLDDIVEFQQSNGGMAHSVPDGPFALISFILINTSTQELAFVDYQRVDDSFGTSPTSNPFRFGSLSTLATIGEDPWGAYTCANFQGPTIVGECETPWLVTEDPTLQELYVDANVNEISGGGTQTFDIRQQTLNIWSGYHGAYTLEDSVLGLLDTTVYSFLNLRTGSYIVDTSVASGIELTFTVEPTLWPAGMTATGAEMAFVASDTYSITVSNVTLEEAVSGLVDGLKLNTDAGRAIIHIAILIASLAIVASFPMVRYNFAAYTLAWTLFGGLASAFPMLHSELSRLMWVLMTMVLWLLTVTAFKGSLSGGSSQE